MYLPRPRANESTVDKMPTHPACSRGYLFFLVLPALRHICWTNSDRLAPSSCPAHDGRYCRNGGFGPEQAQRIGQATGLPTPVEIDRKLYDLRRLGFANPIKMVATSPTILNLATENICGKISDLYALGFVDPMKIITNSPTILTYAIESIRNKLSDLRTLGFMVSSQPPILSYSIETIRTKLSDLRALGFADPVEMVVRFPTMLGCTIENGKLSDLRSQAVRGDHPLDPDDTCSYPRAPFSARHGWASSTGIMVLGKSLFPTWKT